MRTPIKYHSRGRRALRPPTKQKPPDLRDAFHDGGRIRLNMVLIFDTIFCMNSAHKKTLEAIFAKQAPANLEWQRIEALFVAVGARTFLEQAGVKP